MKHFTIEDARQELARVRPIAERMVAAYRDLRGPTVERDALRGRIAGNGGALDRGRFAELERVVSTTAAALATAIGELEEIGVQIKDLDLGLVDFPCRHPVTGEPVLLCWMVGENELGYWHGLDEGFAGRKQLPF